MRLRFEIKPIGSKKPRLTNLFFLFAYSIACNGISPKNGANQSRPAAKTEHKIDDNESNLDDLNENDAIDAKASEAFTIFCERASETADIQENLAEYFENFCVDGVPTKLLTTTLVESAYFGQGEPVIKKVHDWRDDPNAKTTT